jgi:hypothetical protein
MKKLLRFIAIAMIGCMTFATINHVQAEEAPKIIKINGDELLSAALSEEDHKEIIDDFSNSSLDKISEETEKNIKRIKANKEALKIINTPKVNYYDEALIMYANDSISVRTSPEENKSNIIGSIGKGDKVELKGRVKNVSYYSIDYNGKEAFIKTTNLSDDKWDFTYNHDWEGEKLNPTAGVVLGPAGYESYYNLPMGGVISIMRSMGFSEEEYPYWVREDGAKMLGDYIMVAADHSKYPRGSVVMTSLGQGLVCDTGSFIYSTNRVFDVAVTW